MIAGLGAVIALITVVVAQLSWRGWVSGARALLRGEGLIRPMASSGELAPLAIDLRARLRDLEDAYRRSLGPEAPWNAERLRSLLRTQLRGDEVIVVSNREPYIHDFAADGSVVVRRPASGLVTAIEPVMRACSGTWIAHGSGAADRQHGRRQGPPARAARRGRVRPAADLADRRGRAGLLLRLRQRGHVAAVPRRARAAGLSRKRLAGLSRRSTSASPTRWWPRRAATIRSCSCRTTTSRWCRR